MQITLYKNFSKRRNSTKQPSGGTTADVVFKDGCSTENPVFIINGVDLDVNYIGFNSGYYYVDDIVLGNNNIYELHCSIDVLATWRALIGSYYTYIERAESAYDIMINDSMLSSTQKVDYAASAVTDMGFESGCYIFRTASLNGPKLYLTEDPRIIGQLYNNVAYDMTMTEIENILKSLGMSALDCSQYLLSVMWFPLTHAHFPSPNQGHKVSNIGLGFKDVDISQTGFDVYEIVNVYDTGEITLNIPHPVTPEDFRISSPNFVKYSIWLPGVGTVNLNPIDGGRSGSHKIRAYIDMITGAVTYEITHATTGNIVATFDGRIGVDYPMVTTGMNTANVLESTVGAVGGAIAAYETGGAAAAAMSGLSGALDVARSLGGPQGNMNAGGNRAALHFLNDVIVSIELMESKQFAGNRVGRPLCEYRTINTLSGYIKCGAASIDIPGAAPNKDAVNAYLNSGFYYE